MEAVGIEGTVKDLDHVFVLDCFDCGYPEPEELLIIIFDTEGPGDEISQGIEGRSYGNGMAGWVLYGRSAIVFQKWHRCQSPLLSATVI